jgi:hypothetical protein
MLFYIAVVYAGGVLAGYVFQMFLKWFNIVVRYSS